MEQFLEDHSGRDDDISAHESIFKLMNFRFRG